ncbi:uncharacterized protein LOC118268519 isoform X2 [Spodoptera frugiperda]|uniref:Uncharacterized protein LOC118268519 isoform X2 n=1 Tax=Spodoptera frugiperda TaxID=7108 RepID=A0A9R0DIU7_SPOFR|nr:uncharacterized protein LOC118268519 isoform X2 [Spodoptera frugiperda]
MAEEIKMKELTKKRASIKSQLTQFTTFLNIIKSCDQLSEEQLVELEIRIDKMVTIYATYDHLQGQLEYLSAKPDEQFTERELFEANYYKQLASARALLTQHRTQLANKVSSNDLSVVARRSNVRLPKINLPHFSGGYKDWLEFKDIYVSLIHEDNTIDNINKFHYLRSSLSGTASLVIKSLDFRGDNYSTAWQLLCERFDNKQMLIDKHIQALFSVETLQKEGSQGLRQLVDITNKNLRSLATLGLKVQHWDDIIIYLMASKLDPVTGREWGEHKNSLTELPSLETFIKFISNRCNFLETIEETNRLKQNTEHTHGKAKSFSVLTSKAKFNISCPLCRKDHYIFSCEQFKALPVAARLSKAKEFKLCLNCLRPGHLEAACPLGHCKYCKTRHNTMLHSHDNDSGTFKEHITLAGTKHENSSSHVLLSTALVRVTDHFGTPHSARVLLDNGSTANFITKDLCDASEKAYGACIYIRSVACDGRIHTHLLTSKSKVAPIKSTTIPRLELCGALLGTRLCTKVLESLTLKPDQCIFWCDSMIVLGWLSASPATLKPFVRHRVSEMREGFGDYTWRYVPTKDNPADLVSRGLSAELISQSSMWWSGPTFLQTESALWPSMPNTDVNIVLPELVKSHNNINSLHISNLNSNNLFLILINNSSNYSQLKRQLAYIFRFINRCRRVHNHSPTLTNSELDFSANFIIKTVQKEMFPEEYEMLSSGKDLPTKNRLKKLTPFIEAGIIRVGGRLDNSCYDYNVRHPIIICSKHHFTKLIFNTFHLRLFHAGPQLLLAAVRHEYWPLGGRNLAKSTVHKCVKCQRFSGKTVQPIMGNLPKERVQLEFPFLETGTDYAGPILLADRKGRGCRLIKSYICVFVCLATRAVHLELVSDLTKHAFIAALNRFIARRGKPKTIFSDNGTTFIGTCNELADILKQDFSSVMANTGINFSFIPAYTPHFGGLWESAVKSVKHHLRRILGLAHLTYEEMSTCLIQVEAILNSRPLTPLSTDPSDLYPLTPAHFLIGRSLTSLPHPDLVHQNISSLKRFQRIEHLKQQFWNRFSNEYIFYLQQRTKWTDSDGVLEEGAMVVLKEQQTPPLMWPLGRIVRLIPGRDGISRVADVKTKRGIVRRAYNTICPLPV